MRKQNIVLFSSGVSEQNGILDFVKNELDSLGYQCSYWRDLFANARDSSNIALLPMLIKKIPTFDFAVLICEGHDKTQMLRAGVIEEALTMRDNVLFEIGLCTMALGPERVVLLTDNFVRIPDDLRGVNNQSAVEIIIYNPGDTASYLVATEKLVEHFNSESTGLLKKSVQDISDYIKREQSGSLSPTVIGAAVSTANGYVSNFVLRTLEKINEGVLLGEDGFKKLFFFDDRKIFMHIVLPDEYSVLTPSRSRTRMDQFQKGYVPSARFRKAEFRYALKGEELHIYDYPTTLVTGYQTARMILKIDADDKTDPDAEKRFNAKELDLFENALNALLAEFFIRETVVHFYTDDTKEEEEALIRRLTEMISRVTIERQEY